MIRVLHLVAAVDSGGIERMILNYYKAIDKSEFHFDVAITKDSVGMVGKDCLPPEQSRIIKEQLVLQTVRYYLFGKRSIRLALKTINDNQLSNSLLRSYCAYLLKRHIYKKSFGFLANTEQEAGI